MIKIEKYLKLENMKIIPFANPIKVSAKIQYNKAALSGMTNWRRS